MKRALKAREHGIGLDKASVGLRNDKIVALIARTELVSARRLLHAVPEELLHDGGAFPSRAGSAVISLASRTRAAKPGPRLLRSLASAAPL